MLIIFNFDQSKNNSIYLYDIINLIWYKMDSQSNAIPQAIDETMTTSIKPM